MSGIVEKEERDRKVIGLSAANKCIVLSEMVIGMATEMGNADNEDAAIVKLLEKGGESNMKGWNLDCMFSIQIASVSMCCVTCCMSRNKDTTTRYSQLGKKLKNMPDLMDALDPGLMLSYVCCIAVLDVFS